MKTLVKFIWGLGMLFLCFGNPIYGYALLAIGVVLYPLEESED